MRLLSIVVRAMCALVLTCAAWGAATLGGVPGVARADGVEYLQVPSASMGRDIPVAFQAGGPHAVFLLDAFNAGPDVSNWVTAGNAMGTLAGKGISVVAPAGGAFSLYTNWEQDGSKQWETFLSSELPDWLAANKGLAPGGHAIVGAVPGRDRCAVAGRVLSQPVPLCGLDVGLPEPVEHLRQRCVARRHDAVRRRRHQPDVGPAQLGRWKWHDPTVHNQLLIDNNTRLWVFSPQTLTAATPPP